MIRIQQQYNTLSTAICFLYQKFLQTHTIQVKRITLAMETVEKLGIHNYSNNDSIFCVLISYFTKMWFIPLNSNRDVSNCMCKRINWLFNEIMCIRLFVNNCYLQ